MQAPSRHRIIRGISIMTTFRTFVRSLPFLALITGATAQSSAVWPENPAGWPVAASSNRPWTRWWWLGSAVDKPNLTNQLESMAKAGIGGVEICPIYGAMGAEDRFIDFLSPKWMDMLAHTTSEAKRLGMGVDMTTGTGWPFGGPMVCEAMASQGLERIQKQVTVGKSVSLKLPEGKLQCLLAFPSSGGKAVDLTPFVKSGSLQWTPPAGEWSVSGIATRGAIQEVKRAAPGGAGHVLDPYSPQAMDGYLAAFDKAFNDFAAPLPRAQFHDSFEYYGADWTPRLLEVFRKNRGYDLREQLPAFNGSGNPDTVARVRADYRETLGELHRDYLTAWHDWAVKHGGITRNQAHGSPGNLLDHYAVADIPETEIFKTVSEDQIPMLRFPVSAANSKGTNLVSCETFTWLEEHFQVTPEKLKEAADFVFIGGVNHVFFHGIPYSPDDAPWPGWLFYASTHMGPNGGLWKDLPAFNAYLQRCQSVLQDGKPDSEVLIYFPFSDMIADGAEKLELFTVHSNWLASTSFYKAAMDLWNAGVPFDYASDDMLKRATVQDGKIILGSNEFKILVVPGVKHMSLETMKQLTRLKAAGGRVEFFSYGKPEPLDAPGFYEHESRKQELVDEFRRNIKGSSSGDLVMILKGRTGLKAESMVDQGLRFARRRHAEGHHYFIVNRSGREFRGNITLAKSFKSAVVMDPWQPEMCGIVSSGSIPLRLAPLQSIIIRTFSDRVIEGKPWKPAGDGTPMAINGPWKLEFLSGGPELPKQADLAKTAAWTTLKDPLIGNFSGTARYATTFEFHGDAGSGARLDLGKVAHTARVFLNGKEIGVSWCPPHIVDLSGSLKSGRNELAIEVTNLAANRIADLDRRKVPWKQFHEINFVNIDYKPFDASNWPVMESGLIGPVRLLVGGK